MQNINLHVGETGTVQKRVEAHDTAANFGTGDLDTLFATPSLVAVMIEAAIKLVDSRLPEGFITVGKTATVNHEKTTILGETITVKVEVSEFDGTKIVFNMSAYDEIGTIGSGKHERIIVNRKKLLENAKKRAKKLDNMDY